MIKRVTKQSVTQLLAEWKVGSVSKIREELQHEPMLMTISKVAKLLDLSDSTVRRLIAIGSLSSVEHIGPNTAQRAESSK